MSISENRRKKLFEKSEECRQEWFRAETAETLVRILKEHLAWALEWIRTPEPLDYMSQMQYIMALEHYNEIVDQITELVRE